MVTALSVSTGVDAVVGLKVAELSVSPALSFTVVSSSDLLVERGIPRRQPPATPVIGPRDPSASPTPSPHPFVTGEIKNN